MPSRTRLPDLGPRGEGWVIGQIVLLTACWALGFPGVFLINLDNPIVLLLLVVGPLAMLAGALSVAAGVLQLGRSLTPMPRPRDDARLVAAGVYATVRHPIYGGLMIWAIGWAAFTASPAALVAALGLCVWLDAKARREEAWLVERYPGYAAYRARTKRFLPAVY
jgi:protein-S-isoprenylcysteine O-methyltransferase Ste14